MEIAVEVRKRKPGGGSQPGIEQAISATRSSGSTTRW